MANLGRSLLGRVIGGVLSLALAGGAYLVFFKGQEKVEEAKAPKVGECLAVTGTINAEHTEHPCDSAEANYEVVADDGKCDPDAETPYKISLGSDLSSGNVADLCLALNVAKGDCFDYSEEDKVDCASTKGTSTVVKVTRVGKAGEQCANPAQPLENKTRGTLFCLVPNA